jgi:natural product precursor
MKSRKLNKLTLNKNTVANLAGKEMNDAKGGITAPTGTVCGVSWCYPCHTYEQVSVCLTEYPYACV